MNLNLILTFLFCFLMSPHLFSQINDLRVYVLNSSDNSPIPSVHIYRSNDRTVGTVTNEDGYAILKGVPSKDSITVSALGYARISRRAYDIMNDTIHLKPSNEALNEIVISSISPKEVLLKVISNLEQNHRVEPVEYDVFLRSSYHSEDLHLHLLEEQIMKVYQGKNHKSRYLFEKSRIKPFTTKGDSIFKKYRMINATYLSTNNLFIFKHDVLKPRKLKKYTVEYEPSLDQETINLVCHRPGYTHKTKLTIDRETYGILLFSPHISEGWEEKIYFQN